MSVAADGSGKMSKGSFGEALGEEDSLEQV